MSEAVELTLAHIRRAMEQVRASERVDRADRPIVIASEGVLRMIRPDAAVEALLRDGEIGYRLPIVGWVRIVISARIAP